MKQYTRLLSIAGSDSGGGAGIQADIKTFSALGCYGMSVITAITAQNTVSVTGIMPVSIEMIAAQLDAVLSDIGVDAVKIGMLHSADVIVTVAAKLREFGIQNIVLDPVMVAKSGNKLLLDSAVEALKQYLFPLATIITPNLPEAAVILGEEEITETSQMSATLHKLGKLGAGAVLLKGGHLLSGENIDKLFVCADQQIVDFPFVRVSTPNTHGTGCTLSSAIAAFLGKGYALPQAVAEAEFYISQAITAGKDYKIGAGHGPVHHFAGIWDK
jgi:hydroxymethylpyrimidine/phosphomethylpyrimidine kinase